MQEATTFLMTGSEPKYLLAFLNSHFAMYFFSKIGTTTGVGTIRWKKFKLEEFSIPQPNDERLNKILPLVNRLLHNYSKKIEQDVNKQIYDIFNFTFAEIEIIEC